jgi:hypothetical protein
MCWIAAKFVPCLLSGQQKGSDCYGPRHHELLLLVLQVGYSSLLISDFKAVEVDIVENPYFALCILKYAVICLCCQFCSSYHVVM